MNKKLYMACAGAISLAVLGCSDDGISGSSEDPNVLTALGSSSSESETSSSSGTVASSSSFVTNEGSLWDPSMHGFSINVAQYAAYLPANAEADGRWVVETDSMSGGASSVVWPADLVDAQSERTVIESCDGICGTVSLARYSSVSEEPFAGVGFTLAKDSDGNPVPLDVTDWGGVCITYESDAAPSLEMVIGDSLSLLDERSGWRVFANPSVSLPKTTATGATTICRKWSDFKIPAWMKDAPEYWTSDVGAKAAKQLVALKFLISAMPGEYKFNIKNFGTNPGQTSSSSSVAVMSSSSISSSSVALAPYSDLWGAYEEKVDVARYADDSWKNLAHGSWFAYTDGADFSWDDFMAPDDYHDGYLIATMERSDGFLQTEVSMDDANLGYEPIALFGFKLAQDGGDTIPINEKSFQVIPNYIPVDVSNWGGLCVTYTSTVPISMEIGLGSAYNDSLGYNYTFGPGVMPSVSLPVKAADTVACFKWSDFKQANLNRVTDGDKFKISGEDAAKRAGEIVFRVTAKVGLSGMFTIKSLGTNRE